MTTTTTAPAPTAPDPLEPCIALLVEGRPHDRCCCATAAACFEAADKATQRLYAMGLSRREVHRRLMGRGAK